MPFVLAKRRLSDCPEQEKRKMTRAELRAVCVVAQTDGPISLKIMFATVDSKKEEVWIPITK
jgi:hypothetical protein